MGAWPKLFVLFLLCLVGAEVVKAVGKAKPRNEELFDFTKEDDPKFDYSSEHDEVGICANFAGHEIDL